LGEKDAKGTQGGILDAVTGIGAGFAMVRQCIDSSVQEALEIIEASVVESECESSKPFEISRVRQFWEILQLKEFQWVKDF
jgi:hypothetical protein